jgi:hypothetical protein
MKINKPICLSCKNFTPKAVGEYFYCSAFPTAETRTPEELKKRQEEGITIDPKGIPDEILFGQNNHSKPCCSQVGDFVFTPKEK